MKDKLILSILLNESSIDFLTRKNTDQIMERFNPDKMHTNSSQGLHASDSMPRSSQLPIKKDAYPYDM